MHTPRPLLLVAPRARSGHAGVLGEADGLAGLDSWVKDVPPPVLADLYLRPGARPVRPPPKATTWRMITTPSNDN
jgi:hypothetical protein